MSGGGGGVIIIKSKVRELADLEVVRCGLSPSQLAHHVVILGKPESSWTTHETHTLMRHAAIGFDHQCEIEGC